MKLKYEVNNDNYIVYDDEGVVLVFDTNSEKDEFIKNIKGIEKCDKDIETKLKEKNKFLKHEKLGRIGTIIGAILTSVCLLVGGFVGSFFIGWVVVCLTGQSLILYLYAVDQSDRAEKYIGFLKQKKLYFKENLEVLFQGNDQILKERVMARYVNIDAEDVINYNVQKKLEDKNCNDVTLGNDSLGEEVKEKTFVKRLMR